MMETIKTIEGYLPFFPGFYESVYENSGTEYYAVQEEIDYYRNEMGVELTEDDFEFDTAGRRKAITEEFCKAFYSHANDFVTFVTPLGVTNPKEYNYTTNKVVAQIGLDETWKSSLKTYIDEYRDKLAKIVKEDNTSYDGYISFVSNRIETWETIIFNYDKIDALIEKYGRYSDEYIDALKEEFPNASAWDIRDNYHKGDSDMYIINMIGYVMAVYYNSNHNGKLFEALYDDVLEEIYDSDYVKPTEEAEKRIKDAIEASRES